MTTPIKTYDCEGCHSFCYGGYHMEEIADGYGDWVRKEDHDSAMSAANARIAELEAQLAARKPGRPSRKQKANESREIVAARLQRLERPLSGRCAAGSDGECSHSQCPQLRDGEPAKSGRHCPLDIQEEDLS
jgi:hypothetical protein